MTYAISVQGLSKAYLLKHKQQEQTYQTLRESVVAGVKSLGSRRRAGASEEVFWALKDINFEINEGERVGIIGRNGAGKSTLLKLLSRIMEPSAGEIRYRGRLSSLLEVGTGFHPELTGRENIFLNGAILGMGREEIKRKFDEIVEFSEGARFLDTPVKRYSSGMYVRLAFAVSVFLEPDIIVLDEVLAVGDVAFQKKCLRKMKEIGEQGRTVLFVSHSMGAVKSMCNYGLVIEQGRSAGKMRVDEAIDIYLAGSKTNDELEFPVVSGDVSCLDVRLSQHGGQTNSFDSGSPIEVEILFSLQTGLADFRIGFYLKTMLGDTIARVLAADFVPEFAEVAAGSYVLKGVIPANFFTAGSFQFELHCSQFGVRDYFADQISFPITVRQSVIYNHQHPGEESFGSIHLNPGWAMARVASQGATV